MEVITKKWGNSIGVILPKEFVKEKGLRVNQKVNIQLAKTADLSDVFGLIKKRKMSGQKMKNLSRKDWD